MYTIQISKKMKSIFKKNISNLQDTEKQAQKFYRDFLSKETQATLFLEGGLGAGKTFFVQCMLKEAGVTDPVTSPTYTLIQEYNTPTQHFSHFDLYRLKSPQEFMERGFQDIAEQDGIKFVEWPEKITPEMKQLFSGTHFVILLKHGIGVSMRTLEVLSHSQ